MRHISGKNIEIDPKKNTAITIGKFDGLHKGHMALISKLKEVAADRNLATTVLSFTPHPRGVLDNKDIPLILSKHEKLHLLSQLNLDYYIEYPFTHQFAQISPENFIQNVVLKQLRGQALIVGEHFRFGCNGRGNAALANELGVDLGLHVHTMPLVTGKDAAQISSGAIRQLILAKDFNGATQACGRNFFVMGHVVHGKKKGREMGFPTANIVPPKDKLLPPVGVYHTTTFVENIGHFSSITNVDEMAVNTHLVGFDGDLYGHIIRVDFL